jgi:predicted AlkP superfamily pyrophosphatase or phosphodiesterase
MRLLTFALLACAIPAAAQDRDRHVIVISLDGFPAYALHDPSVPLPVLRRLMKEGGAAEGMTPVNPTVTWPNHTSMVTGVEPARHGLIYNGMPIKTEGKPLRVEPWIEKNELVQARTVYDAAHDAGLTTGEVDWVAIYHAPSVNWSFAERPSVEGAVEREMMSAGAITEEQLRGWGKAPITEKDDIWMRAAVHIIEKHKPNLLLMHLLTTDSSQHQYGARTLAANTALILADRQVQRILDAVDRAGIRDKTTILVVSDHGFESYQKVVRPNALLREKGLIREKDGQVVDCDAWVMAEGGTAIGYVTRESERARAIAIMKDAFTGQKGIKQIIWPNEYAKYGYPAPSGGRMGDFVLVIEPGYGFEGVTKGPVIDDVPPGATRGNHGYLSGDPDMTPILVMWGAGVRPGSHTGVQPNVNVAATVAQLLGLKWSAGSPVKDLLR